MPTVKIKFNLDLRIFTLFAALNASGYNDENSRRGMNKMRIQVRKNTGKIKGSMNDFLSQEPAWKWSWRILHFTNPPEFKIKISDWYTKSLADKDFNFLAHLRKFFISKKIQILWNKIKPDYSQELEGYKKDIISETNKFLKWLPVRRYPFRFVIITPNLLDAHWRGFAPLIKDGLFVVMGPCGHKSILKLYRHELLNGLFAPESMDNFVKSIWKKINKSNVFKNLSAEEKTEFLVKRINQIYQENNQKISKEDLAELITKIGPLD